MKLIDERGNLFGKLNIIDLLIVLIIVAGLVGVNYKLGFIKKMGDNEVERKAIVKLWVKNVSKYSPDAVNVGDTVRELKSNSEIGKIINKEVAPTKEAAPDANGKWILSEVPDKNDIFITLETTSVNANGEVKLGSKDGKVGATVEIKGPKFQLVSYVIGVE
jgi:hypothetical protein